MHEAVHELAVHGGVEELVFYPRLREAVPDGDDLAEESIHEHVEMKDPLNALDGLTADDERFDQRMDELMGEVRPALRPEANQFTASIQPPIGATGLRVGLTRQWPNSRTRPTGGRAALAVRSDSA